MFTTLSLSVARLNGAVVSPASSDTAASATAAPLPSPATPSTPTDVRDQFVQSQQQRMASFDQKIADAQAALGACAQRSAKLERAIDQHRAFDTGLSWAFPLSIAAGIGGVCLFHSAPLLLAGLTTAAMSHLLRVVTCGVPVSLYDQVGKVRQEVEQIARDTEETRKDKETVGRQFEETLKLLDAANGRMAKSLGIQEHEEYVTVGGIRLTRRTRA